MLSLADKEALEAEARSWIGTPYHHMGRVKGVGVDCGQIIWAIFEPLLGPFGQVPQYDTDWALHRTDTVFLDFIAPYVIEVEKAEWCDVVLFEFGRSFCHAAFVAKNNKLIHAYGFSHNGSVQENGWMFFVKAHNVRKHKVFRVK